MHITIEALWFIKNILLVVAAIAIIFYTLWYYLLSNWRKYPAGRRVLGFVTSLVAVLGYSLAAVFDGGNFVDFPSNDPALWRVLLGVVVYGLVAYSSIRLDITLVHTWHRGEVHDNTGNPFIPSERTDHRLRRNIKKGNKEQ